MNELISARFPKLGQIGFCQLRYAILKFVSGQSVQNDQTFALLVVGNSSDGKLLFRRTGMRPCLVALLGSELTPDGETSREIHDAPLS